MEELFNFHTSLNGILMAVKIENEWNSPLNKSVVHTYIKVSYIQ